MKDLVSVVIVTKDRRKDLIECIENFKKSSYKNIEIIVVDNDSRPPLIEWLPKKFKKVKLISIDRNVGAAEGRNIGYEVSRGKYIVFSDDDAYPEPKMITELVEVFRNYPKVGIVQPLVYDKQNKKTLQGAGHDINLTTGRIKAWGVREIDRGQYEGVREVPLCGCVWMVKRDVFEKIGLYDEDYFIPYEDSDFSQRARDHGFRLYCTSKAKTYHQGRKETFVHPRIEWLGITSPQRAYRVARNKLIYMRKHSPFPNSLVFFLFLMPLYAISHSLVILSAFRFDILVKYWLGLLSGIFYVLIYPLLKYKDIYKKIDNNLTDFKMLLLAWSDPIPRVLDKRAESILDLACGQGKPMELIKLKQKIKYSEGVDLFEPYIKEAKEKNLHDKYVFKDIRKIGYQKNSFDVVLASHVLEHMSKTDAMKLLKKMEKIAKLQVIIATPIGEMYHPPVDSNPLQIHRSHFYPSDYEKLGYKVLKYGRKSLLGDHGLVHRVQSDFVRKILFTLNILATPFYYNFQSVCDYVFVAYKNVEE